MLSSTAFGYISRTYLLLPPAYPKAWDTIQPGFSMEQAHRAVSELDPVMRPLKGYDLASVDYGDRYWQLRVTYDENECVESVEKHYVHRSLGLFNHSIRLPQ